MWETTVALARWLIKNQIKNPFLTAELFPFPLPPKYTFERAAWITLDIHNQWQRDQLPGGKGSHCGHGLIRTFPKPFVHLYSCHVAASKAGKKKSLNKYKISLTQILNMNQENVSREWNLAVCRLQWHEDGVGVSCRHSLNGLSYIPRPVHSKERWNWEQILPYELGWHGNRMARFICRFIYKRSRDFPLLLQQPETQPDHR